MIYYTYLQMVDLCNNTTNEHCSLLTEACMGLYIDIALAVLMIIILIRWCSRGLADSICAWLQRTGCLLASILVTILCTSLVANLGTLGDSFAGWLESISTIFSGEEGILLAQNIYTVLVGGAIFFVSLITFIYIAKLIKYLFDSLNKVAFFKLCDNTLGGMASLVYSYLLLSILLTATEIILVKFLAGYVDIVMASVADSYILSMIHNYNILGMLVAPKLGVTLPII